MSTPLLRAKALEDVLGRRPQLVEPPAPKISEYFAANVFNEDAMRMFLTEEAYGSPCGKPFPTWGPYRSQARRPGGQRHEGMGGQQGATHYTHWFQPLTGPAPRSTTPSSSPSAAVAASNVSMAACSFSRSPMPAASPMAASATPSRRAATRLGTQQSGLPHGRTLCIPTIFISYTGEALDFKMPLLRAIKAVDQAATELSASTSTRM
jgi:glutamine synthetase